MAKWSGLAPAVDSHLRRWKRVKEEMSKIDLTMQRLDDGGSFAMDDRQFPVAANWALFARSWGLPQADGSIVAPTGVVEGSTINGREQFAFTPASSQNGLALMRKEHTILRTAETVYVAADIVDRITRAAMTMDPEPLFHTDLFAPAGLFILEKPLLIPDYHPKTGELTDYLHVSMRGLSWGPDQIATDWGDGDVRNGPGVLLMSYTTQDDWRTSYKADLKAAIRDGKVNAADTGISVEGIPIAYADYEEAYVEWSLGRNIPRDLLAPMDAMGWSFGKPWVTQDRPTYTPGTVDTAVGYVRRWFLTMMRFSWQKLIVPHRQPLSPKANKRMVLYKKPDHLFSVLRLRRVEDGEPPTGTGMPLRWRTQTRGHWRRVHVMTLGPARNPDGSFNEASHRLKWIDPFWRGPLDAPLGPQHKATVIVR